MTKHINRKHSHIVIEKSISKNQQVVHHQLRQLYHQAIANGDTKEFDLKILDAAIDKDVLTKALISLIVIQNLSFCIVEWLEFYTLCQVLNKASKGKIITSHLGVYTKVEEAFKKHKDIV
jgi:hypothetical protein